MKCGYLYSGGGETGSSRLYFEVLKRKLALSLAAVLFVAVYKCS